MASGKTDIRWTVVKQPGNMTNDKLSHLVYCEGECGRIVQSKEPVQPELGRSQRVSPTQEHHRQTTTQTGK